MPRKLLNNEKKVSKSVRLRKYGIVYNSFKVKNEQRGVNTSKSPRRRRRGVFSQTKDTHSSKLKSKRKSLNSYQKFVKKESKKDKYSNMPGKERLGVIALEWKRKTLK